MAKYHIEKEQNIQDTIGVEPADIDSKEYNDFLFKNPEIKNFFKKYITKTVLPKRQKKGKVNDDIQFLLKLGYGDEIIKMLKESKPTVLDFSGNKMDFSLLSEIGDIDSLEKLDFSDCSLSQIPDSIQNLKKPFSILACVKLE